MANSVTTKYKRLSLLFAVLSGAVTVLPLLVYVAYAFVAGGVSEKITLGLVGTVAVILCLVNVVMKLSLRSPLWILLLGVYHCMGSLEVLLLILAGGSILDELVFTPLHNKYKAKAVINGEIDSREESA